MRSKKGLISTFVYKFKVLKTPKVWVLAIRLTFGEDQSKNRQRRRRPQHTKKPTKIRGKSEFGKKSLFSAARPYLRLDEQQHIF
jgi:hypothetical protein